MVVINESELQDLRNEIRKLGRSPGDFEIRGERDERLGQEGAIGGEVFVRHIRTGVERSYRGGDQSRWVLDCVAELSTGQFDR